MSTPVTARDDRTGAAPPPVRPWHSRDSLWAIVRDPEAVVVVAALGAVLLWGALFWRPMPWFDHALGHRLGRPAFGDVDAYLDTHAATRTLVAHLYFSGGAIALVAVALAGTVLAWIPSRGAGAARYTAIVAAVAGAAVSCVAPVLTSTVSLATWYGRAAQGCWVAVAGFALLALAATLARPGEPVR